jgi:hypothetical protein
MVMKRFLLFVTILMSFGPPNFAADAGTCSKPKVGVELKGISDQVFTLLLKDENEPGKPKTYWLEKIKTKVMEELRKNSPGIDFFSLTGQARAECEYIFSYIIDVIAAGRNIDLGGYFKGEYTAFDMRSELRNHNPCEPSKAFEHRITKEKRNIYETIGSNVSSFGNIGTIIKEREETYRVPPRGPELTFTQKPEKISPLEEERSQEIQLRVTNCKGEPVFDKYDGQIVILPIKTERGEIKETKSFLFRQESKVRGSKLWLYIKDEQGIGSVTYTLKKGVKAGQEHLKMETCGLGKKVSEQLEVEIDGLEIEITPQKRKISQGEQTRVRIEFFKIDKKGMKEPLAGKLLQINVEGLKDGTVSPKGDIATDESGLAMLTFQAGNEDKRVRFIARYQPKDFEEFVQGEAVVEVEKMLQWKGSIVYKKTIDWERDNSDSDNVIRDELHHAESALLNVQFRYSHNYKTREYYKLESMTGTYELDRKFKRNLKPKNPKRGPGGTWTDTAECSGPLNKDQVSVTLVVDPKERKYSLSVGIDSPVCQDKMVVSGNPEGDIVMVGTNNQKISASIPSEEDRPTDGKVIADFLKIPQADGKLDWSWNLSRKP